MCGSPEEYECVTLGSISCSWLLLQQEVILRLVRAEVGGHSWNGDEMRWEEEPDKPQKRRGMQQRLLFLFGWLDIIKYSSRGCRGSYLRLLESVVVHHKHHKCFPGRTKTVAGHKDCSSYRSFTDILKWDDKSRKLSRLKRKTQCLGSTCLEEWGFYIVFLE